MVVATTFNFTVGLVNPDRVNEISVLPAAIPVAIPVEAILATPVLELDQVTGTVISEVTPFEYVPVAFNG